RLPGGQAEARGAELVLDLGPQGGPLQAVLYPVIELGLAETFIEPHAERHTVVDRHGEGGGLLEHHADRGAELAEILAAIEDILAVEHDLALGPLARIE